ncbi:response regulator transcription factor [Caminibacter mediatlanticus TB-2]|uniref:Response regulator receiver domain protein (CheY-like) n=1 Tax=Caminibacter mediatlanticus TB-2 TaxID=391592 RepID=A0AAI9F0S4_9BACT|nr:response regulator transcription factor [Caminibacter mediatlanticus]EDM22967.1 response regulator receiver domain protein (CheY-like) [Caminibacter mediatlanticus TB-2]QCT95299.1 response regulator transcription factor [Caminibacter mediatlanticus TB-2]
MKVLLVEDDKKLAKIIEKGLKRQNFRVDVAEDGEEGLYLARNNKYDVMIIDWMLPKLSGIDLIKTLRKEDINTPTLILTAKSDLDDKVEGLSVADDYLTKPFEFEELIARLKALFRRNKKLPENIIKVGDLEMNLDTKEVKRAGKPIELTAKQFELLKLLMINKNKIVTPEMIEENLWEMNEERDSNVITAHISYLRKKIDKGFDKELLKTIRGMGYKISDE